MQYLIDNKKSIAVFTANQKGGIVQLAVEVFRQISKLGYSVYCYLPDDVTGLDFDDVNEKRILWYKKIKPQNKLESAKFLINPCQYGGRDIIQSIYEYNIGVFWAVDSEILTSSIINTINKEIYSLITVHDVVFHPSNDESFKTKILRKFHLAWRKKSMLNSDKIIVLSEESMKKFNGKYHKYFDKTQLLTLGAHITSLKADRPIEVLYGKKQYFLFFGRFEKYKGLDVLANIFSQPEARGYNLIVAGDGEIDNSVQVKMRESKNINLIKRYITDAEMVWLIKNSLAVILPYSEASQSGVIPISYYFGVPVVVSNIAGLTQFVENRKSGLICNGIEDYIDSLKVLANDIQNEKYSTEAKEYYRNNMDWTMNIKKVLNTFMEEG